MIPGQPAGGVLGDLLAVLLQGDEILEGIDLVELAGVDQAHVDVADPGAVKTEPQRAQRSRSSS